MKNIRDLARRVSDNLDISVKEAHAIIEETFKEIAKILIEEEEEVRIKNFATFKFGVVPGKETKHPTTKERITIPKKKTIRLGLSTKIKKGLNEVVEDDE